MPTSSIFGGGNAAAYPQGNFFPATRDDVGFAADFSLAATSPYAHAGSDGKDLGADIAAIAAATSGAL